MTDELGREEAKKDIPTNRQQGRKGMQDELGTRPSKNKETAIKQRKNDTNQEGKGQ